MSYAYVSRVFTPVFVYSRILFSIIPQFWSCTVVLVAELSRVVVCTAVTPLQFSKTTLYTVVLFPFSL